MINKLFLIVSYRFFLPVIAFWLLTINLSAGFSQGNAFVFPFSQKISFAPNPDSEERITNDLLQHIAEGSGRLRSLLSYEITGNMVFEVVPGTNRRLTGAIKLESLSVQGDIHYREFSIGSVLIPDLVSLEFVVRAGNGKVIYNERLQGVSVSEPGKILYRFELPRMNGNGTLQPEIQKIRFSYSLAAYQRLDTWFGYLEEYYRAGSNLSALHKEVAAIDFSDPNRLILAEFALCEAERQIELISRMDFMRGLDAAAGDPERVFSTFYEVKDLIYWLRNDFNHKMAVIDSLLYVSGKEYLQRGDMQAARQRFENALVLNPLHVPSHLVLAEIDLGFGNKSASIKRLTDVFSTMFPYGEWRRQAEALTDSVMAQFFREAFNLNREGRFKESLDMMAPLETFCEKTRGFFECPEEVAFRLNQAHMGMYRSFLVVGNRALRNDNLNLCRIYTASAIEYQQNNMRFVPDANEAYDLLQQAVNRHLELAAGFFSAAEYLNAADHYQAAADLCSQFTELYCAPNVQRRQQLALDMHQRRSAPDLSDSPVAPVIPEPEMLNLPPLSGQPREELLERLRFGQLQAWAGNLAAARQAQEEVNRIRQRFRLATDQIIMTELRKLDQQIREKECELAVREFEALLKRGANLQRYGEIKLAAETGQKAKAILHAHQDCNINPGDELDVLLALGNAVIFLDKIEEAKNLYAAAGSGDYRESLEKYHSAERFFREYQPQGIDINDYRLSGFLTRSGNTEFVKAGIAFMTGHVADYEHEIIDLLFFLKNSGFSRNQTRSLQDLAGRKMAAYYHSAMPEQRPELLVRRFTGRDPWFRFFEQAFVRFWNIY